MTPFLNKKMYYTRFSFLRKQYRFSLKTSNVKVARRISDQIERGLERGLFDSFDKGTCGYEILCLMIGRPGLRAEEALESIQTKGRTKPLSKAIADYLDNCKQEHSESNYRNEVRVFRQFSEALKVGTVSQVSPEMIERWRNNRVEAVSKSTVNRELKMVKRFFGQCVDKGHISRSPAEKIKTFREPEKEIRHLSDSEVKKLLGGSSEDLCQIITFFLLTGLRYGELCYLTWKDVDLRRGQVIVQAKDEWRPKSLRKRVIPLHNTARAILEGLDSRKSEYVFPDRAGKCSYPSLRSRIYSAFKRANVKGNVKDLRSTFASNAVMSGMPIYTVSKLLGHHDVKITEKHYAHLAPDYMGNAISALKSGWMPSSDTLMTAGN